MSFKIGVVSFAHMHATSYLSSFVGMLGIELLTCDPDQNLADSAETGARGKDLADQYGADYVESFEELLAWAPNAVMICSENSLHHRYALAALAADAHVLSEKPLTTNPQDAQELVALAQAKNRLLMVAFPVRFAQEVTALKRFISEGHLGEVRSILGQNNGNMPFAQRRWFTHPELAGGGAIVDHTVHCADLIDYLVDREPRTVYAVANNVLHADKQTAVETAGLVSVQYEGDLVATIDCSWSLPDIAPTWGGLSLNVTGDRGSIGIDLFGTRVAGHGQHGTSPTLGPTPGALWLAYGENTDAIMIAEFIKVARAWDHEASEGIVSADFSDDLKAQIQALPTASSGVRTVQIVAAALRSVRTGQPEPVESESTAKN